MSAAAGEISRWQSGLINFRTSVMFGLLILAAVVIWLMVMRGGIWAAALQMMQGCKSCFDGLPKRRA